MERKSLRSISWDVSEETYRADPALSYSTLAGNRNYQELWTIENQ